VIFIDMSTGHIEEQALLAPETQRCKYRKPWQVPVIADGFLFVPQCAQDTGGPQERSAEVIELRF